MKFCAFKGRKPLEVGRRQIVLRLRRRHLGLRSSRCQLVVLRVELGQHLPGTHALPQFGLALHDLAGHPKAQARLGACAHLTRIVLPRLQAPTPRSPA